MRESETCTEVLLDTIPRVEGIADAGLPPKDAGLPPPESRCTDGRLKTMPASCEDERRMPGDLGVRAPSGDFDPDVGFRLKFASRFKTRSGFIENRSIFRESRS